MFKKLLIFLLFGHSVLALAKLHVVKLGAGTEFISPKILNIYVGDTVRFVNFGTFNTTTSLVIPPGARPWDIDLKTFKSHFDIKFDVEGKYEYFSERHHQIIGEIVVKILPVPVAKPYVTHLIKSESIEFYIGQALTDEVDVKVFDLLGKLIVEQKINLASGRGQFGSKYLKKGIYFLKVFHDYKQVFFFKFIKD